MKSKPVPFRCPECRTKYRCVQVPRGMLSPHLCGKCGARGRARRLVRDYTRR